MNVLYMLIILFAFSGVTLFFWAFFRLMKNDFLSHYKTHSISLSEIFYFIDSKRIQMYHFLVICFCLSIGFFFYCLTGQLHNLIILFLVSLFVPQIWIIQMKKKRFKLFDEQLPDALTILSNSLRSGQNLPLAINTLVNEHPPPISQEFSLVIMQTRIGLSMKKALENLSNRVLNENLKKNEDLQLLVTSVNVVHDMGGNLRIIFQSIEELIRKRKRIQKKIKSITAMGRYQGMITSLITPAMGLFMYYNEPGAMSLMFNDPAGKLVIFLIIIFQITGYLIIRKITNIKV